MGNNKSISELKKEFNSTVNVSHIKYDWDAGHAYSYVSHPLAELEFEDSDDMDEWDSFVSEWLSENEDCPPCQISIKNRVVSSGCGCHDGLDIVKDAEVIADIIRELESYGKG